MPSYNLNSYDNYPSGERKYSSGAENNTAYSDNPPVATIYTSTKTGASINVETVEAVRITVLRADGSGEKVIIYSDGTKTPYSVTIVTKEGIKYATFDTNHFSTYVLADTTKQEEIVTTQDEKDETPKTGTMQIINYISIITIISAIAMLTFNKKTKVK